MNWRDKMSMQDYEDEWINPNVCPYCGADLTEHHALIYVYTSNDYYYGMMLEGKQIVESGPDIGTPEYDETLCKECASIVEVYNKPDI